MFPRPESGDSASHRRGSGSRLLPGINQGFHWINTRVEHFEFSSLAARFVSLWPRIRKPLLYKTIALYALSGIYMLSTDEVGVIQRFGRKLPL